MGRVEVLKRERDTHGVLELDVAVLVDVAEHVQRAEVVAHGCCAFALARLIRDRSASMSFFSSFNHRSNAQRRCSGVPPVWQVETYLRQATSRFVSLTATPGGRGEDQGYKFSIRPTMPVWTLNWPQSLTSHTRSTERAEHRPAITSPAFVWIR
jgi:hypothetical protein